MTLYHIHLCTAKPLIFIHASNASGVYMIISAIMSCTFSLCCSPLAIVPFHFISFHSTQQQQRVLHRLAVLSCPILLRHTTLLTTQFYCHIAAAVVVPHLTSPLFHLSTCMGVLFKKCVSYITRDRCSLDAAQPHNIQQLYNFDAKTMCVPLVISAQTTSGGINASESNVGSVDKKILFANSFSLSS